MFYYLAVHLKSHFCHSEMLLLLLLTYSLLLSLSSFKRLFYCTRNVDTLNTNWFLKLFFVCLLSCCFVQSCYTQELHCGIIVSFSCSHESSHYTWLPRHSTSIWSFFFFEGTAYSHTCLQLAPNLVPRKCFCSYIITVSRTFVILKISLLIHHLPQWQQR